MSTRSSDSPRGALIVGVSPGSPAARAGLAPGSRLVSINGRPVRDDIDLLFLSADEALSLIFLDGEGRERRARLRKSYEQDLGIALEEYPIRRCNNRCVFCFIDQNPPGLRAALYFKDGDFRMSFTHGNYITTTNLSQADLERIAAQRLSPLYISVHSTNEELRLRMLGVKKAPPILERLRFLTGNGIDLHTQIVLCPGWNDGAELERTARELAALGPRLLSIAVVPVGRSDYRAGLPPLRPVSAAEAGAALRLFERLRGELERGREERLLFCADELYLLAGAPWPEYGDCDVLHQLENGVGMLYHFYDGFEDYWAGALRRPGAARRRVAALTGGLGAIALAPLAQTLNAVDGLEFRPIALRNSLFGASVTVSGLLPGRDFAAGARAHPGFDRYLIPGNALRDDGVFLDDMTLADASEQAGAALVAIEGGAEALARAALEP